MLIIIVLANQHLSVHWKNLNPQAQYKMCARSVENFAAAKASVQEDPNMSPTRRSQALGISVTSLWKDLGLHSYKIQLKQELKPLDHQKRRMFVNRAQQQLEKSSSAMRLISGWIASSINKICVIGQTAIHTYSRNHHCIPKKLRCGAVFGLAASLAVILP